jgi:hypothetical protein
MMSLLTAAIGLLTLALIVVFGALAIIVIVVLVPGLLVLAWQAAVRAFDRRSDA